MRTPTLREAFAAFIKAETSDFYFPLPARVERFDPSTGTADVLPLIKFPRITESGDEEKEALPVLPSVPVVFPGLGDFALTFPVSAGDLGLVVFCGASIDEFLATGQLSEPFQERKASLSDGVFIPGLRFSKAPFSGFDSSRVVLGHADGARVSVDQSSVRLGDPVAGSLVALAAKVETELNALRTVINTHIHSGVTTGPGASGPLVTPAGPISSTAANGVFAKE